MNLMANLSALPPLNIEQLQAAAKPATTYKRDPKGYNNEKLRRYGVIIAQTEITKQIGAVGIDSCLAIGVMAESIITHYRDYLDLAKNCEMDPRYAAEYFAPTVYETLSPNQRQLLEATMRQEHQDTVTAIRKHLALLESLVDQLKTFGPTGQRELFRKRRQLQGFTDEEIEQELAEQEGGLAA